MAAKIVTVTGISGSGSRGFCERYAQEGKKTKVYHTGDMTYQNAQQLGQPKIPKENLLNMHPMLLEAARNRTFETIIKNLPEDKRKYDVVLIDTHAQFFWNQVYDNAYDWNHLNELGSDMFVTIIDKPSSIKERQMQTPHGRAQKHDYRDLLLWQNVEVNVTKGWASKFGKPMYTFSSKQKAQDLTSLLTNWLLVYPSFAMTDATQRDTEEIESFKRYLRESRLDIDGLYLPINDPADIDIEQGDDITEVIRQTIDAQTVRRDYGYIWQGTHTLAFCPSVKTPVSKGQGDEIKEAHDMGKFVYLISPKPEKFLSPFYKYVHQIFKSKEEFMPFWQEHLKWALEFYKR